MAVEIKYGHLRGGEQGFPVTVAASQVFLATSAKFVKRTAAGTATVTKVTGGATDSNILGHLELQEVNSSDGTEVVKCINDDTAIYRVPVIHGTYAATMKGRKCDIAISSAATGLRQGASMVSDTYGHLIIVDGDLVDNSWVDVRINKTYAEANIIGVSI